MISAALASENLYQEVDPLDHSFLFRVLQCLFPSIFSFKFSFGVAGGGGGVE